MSMIYHAVNTRTGQEGYAKEALGGGWLFVERLSVDIERVERDGLVLMGDVETAAAQRQDDGSLVKKVCGY
jgi:hypothetical protein